MLVALTHVLSVLLWSQFQTGEGMVKEFLENLRFSAEDLLPTASLPSKTGRSVFTGT